MSLNGEPYFQRGVSLERVGVVARFALGRLRRAEKGVVRRYLRRTTGYSRRQLTRLIGRCRKGRPLTKRYRRPTQPRTYTAADVTLLAQTDVLHHTVSGPATRCLMRRAFAVCGDAPVRAPRHPVGRPPVYLAAPGGASGHPPALDQDPGPRRRDRRAPRPRHSNDYGLAETKNGAIVRKSFGYAHIPQRLTTPVNTFCHAL
jgi:hypothetical protein